MFKPSQYTCQSYSNYYILCFYKNNENSKLNTLDWGEGGGNVPLANFRDITINIRRHFNELKLFYQQFSLLHNSFYKFYSQGRGDMTLGVYLWDYFSLFSEDIGVDQLINLSAIILALPDHFYIAVV